MRLPILEFETANHIYIPPGLKSDPRFIMPDDVVAACARAYDLTAPGLRGIDPMCGVGTIPRVITQLGGSCDAVEIDAYQFEVARRELSEGVKIIHADCFTHLPDEPYDYIYTSAPLVWFKHYPAGLTSQLGHTLKRLLKPGGLLIMDSDDITHRGDESWPVAEPQIDYFTSHGFHFQEARKFVTRAPMSACDTTFVELVFSLNAVTS